MGHNLNISSKITYSNHIHVVCLLESPRSILLSSVQIKSTLIVFFFFVYSIYIFLLDFNSLKSPRYGFLCKPIKKFPVKNKNKKFLSENFFLNNLINYLIFRFFVKTNFFFFNVYKLCK